MRFNPVSRRPSGKFSFFRIQGAVGLVWTLCLLGAMFQDPLFADPLRISAISGNRISARYTLPSEVAGLTNGHLMDIYQGIEKANMQDQALGFVDTVVFVSADKSNAFFRIFGEESRWLLKTNMVLLPTGRSISNRITGSPNASSQNRSHPTSF